MMGKKKKRAKRINKAMKARSIKTTENSKKPKVSNIVTTMLLVPVVIGFSISTMLLSYMFIPVATVLIIGTILYQVIKANKKYG